MEPMLSIDFGNSFTKVGLRYHSEESSVFVSDEQLNFDGGLNLCVPTVVASAERPQGIRWAAGVKVVDLAGEGINVFTNWKPALFRAALESQEAPQTSGQGNTDPIDSFLAGLNKRKEYREYLLDLISELAGVAPTIAREEVQGYSLSTADLIEAVRRLGGEPPDETPGDNWRVAYAQALELTQHFFAELKAFLTPKLREVRLDIHSVPVRVAVPAFVEHHPSSQEFLELLRDQGWRLAERKPLVSEPWANAIGVLSGGRNDWVYDKKSKTRFPHYGAAFNGTHLGEALKAWATNKSPRWYHHALIIDIGAYTTDFAALDFVFSEISDSPVSRVASEPHGIARLEQDYLKRVPAEAAQAVIDSDFRQRLNFREAIFNLGQEYMIDGHTFLGSPRDVSILRECLIDFAQEILESADRLLTDLGFDDLHDLILTGGGFNIPRVRDYIVAEFESRGVECVLYAGAPNQQTCVPGLFRGATALGGASVLYDGPQPMPVPPMFPQKKSTRPRRSTRTRLPR